LPSARTRTPKSKVPAMRETNPQRHKRGKESTVSRHKDSCRKEKKKNMGVPKGKKKGERDGRAARVVVREKRGGHALNSDPSLGGEVPRSRERGRKESSAAKGKKKKKGGSSSAVKGETRAKKEAPRSGECEKKKGGNEHHSKLQGGEEEKMRGRGRGDYLVPKKTKK